MERGAAAQAAGKHRACERLGGALQSAPCGRPGAAALIEAITPDRP